MSRRIKFGKNQKASKEEVNKEKSTIIDEEPLASLQGKRKPDKSPESLALEAQVPLPKTKKIKQQPFIPPVFQPATQPIKDSIEEDSSFDFQFQSTKSYSNPFPLSNMKSNFQFGRNKDLEEEYRLLEELINTENKYHAQKFKQIIIDLKSKEEYKILEAVTHLSTELSMAQEENFASFQLDVLIPELVNCLQMENPEIMMHATISITHILDILPATSKILVNCGGVEVLCQKMQNFEYIDVAESAIKALEKISYDNGLAILSTGGMEMMISMVDFFVVSTQKLIISIISNIFRLINTEAMLKDKVLPILPIVLSYTQNDPSRQEVLFSMIARLTERVVRVCGEDYEKKQEYLEIIAQENLTGLFCVSLSELVENFDHVKIEQIENILKTLNRLCYFSLRLCLEAFNSGLIHTIDKLINILEASIGKENQFSILAYETISLVNSILALRATPHPMIGKIAAHIGIRITENSNVEGRLQMFKENPMILEGILEKIGTRLPGIYENNAGAFFKYLVLISFQKLVEFSTVENLKQKLDLQMVATFISKLTTSNDIMVIAVTLLITELLITKIPEAFLILTREGVIDYIKSLSVVSEVNKLEAYSIMPKKVPGNPLDALKQLTTSIGKISTGSPNEFLANLEMESQRLENIMQQLQSLKNLESFPNPANNNNNNNNPINPNPNNLLPKPMNPSGDEGYLLKNPQLSKNAVHNRQNLPKTASLENKFITSLNKKQNPDEMNIEDEEQATEKNIPQQQAPVDKMTELRREVASYAAFIYTNMKEDVQKNNFPFLVPTAIINKLEEISLALEQNLWNPVEFGQKYFQKYIDLINEYGGITNHELKSSKLLTHFLNFLFDNLLASKEPVENPEVIQPQPKEGSGHKKFRLRNKDKEEEKKSNAMEEEVPKESAEKVNFELSDQQCRTILGRVISFLYYFKQMKNKNKEEIYLQDFLRNLQEMLTTSDQFSLESGKSQEHESSLSSELRFLAQRVKFKAQYTPESKAEKKKGLTSPDFIKQKSAKMEEEKPISTLETQNELFMYKDSVFKDVPLLALSVEQFGTLEVIEDYLLNKLNSKEDLNGGGFMGNLGRNINEFMTEKFENNPEGESEEEEEEEEEDFSEEQQEGEEIIQKKGSANKVPVNNPKSKSPGALSLQKSHSHMKTKYESKFMKNDKKRWVDRLTGKEINFKKFLELKFFIGEEEISKSKTVYEIFRNRAKNMKFGANEEMVINFKLVAKKIDALDFLSGKEQPKQPNLVSLDAKSILSNLLSKVAAQNYITKDSNLKEIIQMIAFIYELSDLDKRIRSPATVFNGLLIELKTQYGLGPLIEAYRAEGVQLHRAQLIDKSEFINKHISAIIYKFVNDPLTLAAGTVPKLFRDIGEKASFLLDFKSKYNFYKNACSHISRALYYICHTNKARLKELESLKIGKIHRKKIKVMRNKVLENAVVNFETYGYKKAILDFEFQGEEGTGLGPTLEYYAIVASELKNPDHNLWRNTVSNLLFPSPINPLDLKYSDPSQQRKKLSAQNPENKRDFEKFQLIFRCAGTMVARSVLDERMVDLPFHPIFWNVLLEKPLHLEDIAKIDPSLGETLLGLQEIVNKKQEIEKDTTLSLAEKSERVQELKFKGANIEDLALNFTFPGYPEIELIENGEDMPVTLSNLDQYVTILARYVLQETLKSQSVAFQEGFDKVIPINHLGLFEGDEIETLVCGGRRDEDWDIKTLEANFIPAHGYHANSKSFKNFIELVANFTEEEKRIFLKFVTGAERLPYGGFKNLNPKLTVVKKQPNFQHEHPDEYLPSVMTCQNYVKLPDYSTIDSMREKFLLAMKEGQNSFSLS